MDCILQMPYQKNIGPQITNNCCDAWIYLINVCFCAQKGQLLLTHTHTHTHTHTTTHIIVWLDDKMMHGVTLCYQNSSSAEITLNMWSMRKH